MKQKLAINPVSTTLIERKQRSAPSLKVMPTEQTQGGFTPNVAEALDTKKPGS